MLTCIIGHRPIAQCRSACLLNVYSNVNMTIEAVLSSAECMATPFEMKTDLVYASCSNFPACSFFKQVCLNSTSCRPCLEHLASGNSARAAELCPYHTTSGHQMDVVVWQCTGASQIGCDFWMARCASNTACTKCLASMGDRTSFTDVVALAAGPACEVFFPSSSSLARVRMHEHAQRFEHVSMIQHCVILHPIFS